MTNRNNMKRHLCAALVGILVVSCEQNDWKTTDDVKIIRELKSPDGKHIATVFECSGGGAAGYTYTNVNLRKSSDDFDQREILLGKYLWNSFKDIEVAWKNRDNLQVSYSWQGDNAEHKERNNQKVSEKDGISISYTLR